MAVAVAAFGACCVCSPTPVHAATDDASRLVLGIGADETQANLSWQTRTSNRQFLEYAKVAGGDVVKVEARRGGYNPAVFFPHEAVMRGLEPETTYWYRVGSDEAGWTPRREFRTGAQSDRWSFVAMADAQIGVNLQVSEQAQMWRRTLDSALAHTPEAGFVLHLGDQVEGWGAPVKQYKAFLSPRALGSYRLAVLKGNHETYGVTPKKHFDDAFFLPNEVLDSANYFYTYNNVLFLGLDTNRNSQEDIAEHVRFVREVIAAHGASADWVVLTMHHSLFSQGTHYTDSEVERLRAQLAPELSAAGVDVVLSGHDHIYTRSHLMEGTQPVGGSAKAGDILEPHAGQTLYLTTTTAGGGKFYHFQDAHGTQHPNLREDQSQGLTHFSTARWRQDYTPDFLTVDVTDQALTLTTTDVVDGCVVDKVTVVKDSAGGAAEAGGAAGQPENLCPAGFVPDDGSSARSTGETVALWGVGIGVAVLLLAALGVAAQHLKSL